MTFAAVEFLKLDYIHQLAYQQAGIRKNMFKKRGCLDRCTRTRLFYLTNTYFTSIIEPCTVNDCFRRQWVVWLTKRATLDVKTIQWSQTKVCVLVLVICSSQPTQFPESH